MEFIVISSIFGLPTARLLTSLQTLRHTQDEFAYEPTWYATPALFQRLTKPIPLILCHTVIIVLWILLIHAFFEMPLEVFNGVKVW